MNVLPLPRQRGKTLALVLWATSAETPEDEARVIVFMDEHESMRVLHEFQGVGLLSWQCVSIGEVLDGHTRGGFLSGVRLTRHIVYGIDNLDIILPRLLCERVDMVTLTEEES